MARTLRVHCNPWHAVDAEGRPVGACPLIRQPQHVNTHQGFVSANVVASAPEKLPQGHAGTPNQETLFQFSPEPQELDNDIFGRARQAIRSGELIAADEETAKAVGVKFVPLADAVAAAKEQARAKRKAIGLDIADIDPFAQPLPGGKESPVDVAAKSGAERAAKKGQ